MMLMNAQITSKLGLAKQGCYSAAARKAKSWTDNLLPFFLARTHLVMK
jgi:hypothetical protein